MNRTCPNCKTEMHEFDRGEETILLRCPGCNQGFVYELHNPINTVRHGAEL